MILKCSCENKQQDTMYGKDMRVHNKTTKINTYRCVVCGKERAKV
jgi:hypothetical protein